ncbi:DUF6479 family protein [Streptomyces sp. CRN 30]|uniref:DUF6479 family protein n=1 Tax=Streptomyces sp. CRN 30 TaxID=3075613 RepID=UPI002A8281AE|nr:DUF6479 family protein [Streptomyces sp. CRN 30]
MTSAWVNMAASNGAMSVGLIVAAFVVVALLIGAFAVGIRVKRRESPPPTPDEQPHMPAGGPVREMRETRSAEEVPRSDERMLPHDLHRQGSRSDPGQPRRRWDEGSSGSFGSGGPGGGR